MVFLSFLGKLLLKKPKSPFEGILYISLCIPQGDQVSGGRANLLKWESALDALQASLRFVYWTEMAFAALLDSLCLQMERASASPLILLAPLAVHHYVFMKQNGGAALQWLYSFAVSTPKYRSIHPACQDSQESTGITDWCGT